MIGGFRVRVKPRIYHAKAIDVRIRDYMNGEDVEVEERELRKHPDSNPQHSLCY
jgi:hypothetical protein